MIQGAYQPRHDAQVHVFDAADLPWQPTPEAGLSLKAVRYDNTQGLFLGLVRFDAMARSGLHQHRGVATSLVLEGGLTDYQGPIGLHQVGINLHGATHDAIAYAPTLLVSRLEGPVAYPKERSQLTGLHAGSHHDDIVNPAPERPPDINIDIDTLTAWHTGVTGLQRQLIFDYAGTGSSHRFVQWRLRPGTVCPAWRTSAVTEFWVRGGLVWVNGRLVRGNSFIVAEPGAELDLRSPHGALVLAWAEGAERWLQPPEGGALVPGLFGF